MILISWYQLISQQDKLNTDYFSENSSERVGKITTEFFLSVKYISNKAKLANHIVEGKSFKGKRIFCKNKL